MFSHRAKTAMSGAIGTQQQKRGGPPAEAFHLIGTVRLGAYGVQCTFPDGRQNLGTVARTRNFFSKPWRPRIGSGHEIRTF